jgi:hypothetical protein
MNKAIVLVILAIVNWVREKFHQTTTLDEYIAA